jgi:hypothetical protein
VIVEWGSGTERLPPATTLTAKICHIEKADENRGHIVTIDSLCQAVWGGRNFGYEITLIVHIRRLREKIEWIVHPQTCAVAGWATNGKGRQRNEKFWWSRLSFSCIDC